MSSEVTREIKKMAEKLVATGIYKSQSEVVRDGIRQLAYKYGMKPASLEEVRKITLKGSRKSSESLSQAVKKIREEA